MVLPFLIFLVSVSFVSATLEQTTPGPGTPIDFNKADILSPINAQRQFWKVPLVAWDEDVAKIAALTCSQCNWNDVRPQAERQKLLTDLKGLPFKDINDARYQTVGENREHAGGAAPISVTGTTWLNRSAWNCAENSCAEGKSCAEYTQVVWNNTLNMGCGKCSCNVNSPIPDAGPDAVWIFLVCNFVEAGNFEGKHPFGDGEIKEATCGGTYVAKPPPQPTPCEERTCADEESCPSPLTAATCDTVTGNWKAGAVRAADFNPIPLACGLEVTSFTANAGDKVRVDGCGVISVSGATTFNGNPTVDVDFKDVAGLVGDHYQAFFQTASPISGGVWASAVAQGVWSPNLFLSAQAITGNTTSYVLLHDASITDVVVDSPLPDGSEMVTGGQSPSSAVIRSSVEGSGGDINDPDLQTEPKKNIDGTPAPAVPAPATPTVPETPNNGSGGPAIPGWAIFLIVLACILIIIVIVVIIVLLAGGSSGTEKF